MILSGLLCSILMVLGLGITHILAENGLHQSELLTQLKVPQCRERCIEQFNIGDLDCLQRPECLVCWNSCTATSSEQSLPPSLQVKATHLDVIKLKIHSMIREGSLTSADITWKSTNIPSQCLVTWEVSGGGLMGNLLTDTPDAQLSLWPDTKYRVQVTCKNKITGNMSKSLPVMIDTSDAIVLTTSTTTTTQTFMVTKINHLLSNISQSTNLDQQTTILPSVRQSYSSVANTVSNDEATTTSSKQIVKKNPNNIKVIVPRYQNAASTKYSKLQSNIIFIGLVSAMLVLFFSFLVICSIFLIKVQRKSMECDKKMLIGNSSEVVNGSEFEFNMTKKNLYLV